MEKIEEARKKLIEISMDKKIEIAPRSSPDLLSLLLEESEPQLILACLDNPHVNENQVFTLAKKESTPAEVIEKIAKNRAWLRSIKLQKELVTHPHTPISIAMEFLRNFSFIDIVQFLNARNLQPGLRQFLFEIFRQRISQMGESQRANMLGRVPSDAAQIILEMGGELVLQEGIKFNYIRQYQALKVARSSQSSPKLLTLLYETPPWGQQYEVKWSLLMNDSTPRDIRMKIFRTLSSSDQQRFKKLKRIPGFI